MRFIHKYKKWYGVDREVAKAKWDDYVRDRSVQRYHDEEGVLFMAVPLIGTAMKVEGSRLADRRCFSESRKL